MKKSSFVGFGLWCGILLFSCESEQDYKEIRTEVVAVHDKVMTDGDVTFKQRTLLDSFSRVGKLDDQAKLKVVNAISSIDVANHQMEKWMNNFEPDASQIKGNPVKYFQNELLKIKQLDTTFRSVMVRADHLLDSLKH